MIVVKIIYRVLIAVEDTIEKLEQRIIGLIELCERLGRENETLKTDQQLLQQQYMNLQEKNKIARGRIEQIVSRLDAINS